MSTEGKAALIITERWRALAEARVRWAPEAFAADFAEALRKAGLLTEPTQEGDDMRNEDLQRKIADFSARLDNGLDNGEVTAQEMTYARVAKISEEAGEVSASLLRLNGHNVLKEDGTVTAAKVGHDILSVAITALAVYEHWTGSQGNALDALNDRIDLLDTDLETYSQG